jgi:LysR family glycine cleavage system transcriptional activator
MADFRRLPNLAALRAFEAAARHQNFSRAAEEIHVTHGAISHQVRSLEEDLGIALFTRHGKRLTVTPEGERFAATIRKSLIDIAEAADAIKSSASHKRLTITTLPSFAARWLAPRLGKFIDLHPDTEVVLQSSGHLADFYREAVDVGIRFGAGHYPGLAVEKLMGDYYFVAASPNYKGGKLPASPHELGAYTLLRSDDDERWSPWFQVAGVNLPEPTGGVQFQDLSMLVRLATSGDGVALVRHVVAAQEIKSGELVQLFDVTMQSEFAYYFVCTPHALQKPQVQAFRTWLREEIAQFKSETGWVEQE